jgi:serine protease
MMVLTLLVGLTTAAAFPTRAPAAKPHAIVWEPGRRPDVLIVKLAEEQGLRWSEGRLEGPGDLTDLSALLQAAKPHFTRPPEVIRQDRETWDPEHRLADLTLYLRIEGVGAAALGTALLAFDQVETAFLAPEAVEPPSDIPPETPDFEYLQEYLDPAPDGFGFLAARNWPGGTGANVTVVDIEYGWDARHEDLGNTEDAFVWGWNSETWTYHGNAVLGQLVAEDNGYGVTGIVPDAEPLVVSPYDDDFNYNVAAAVDAAASILDAGDVILIEQQAWVLDTYAPISVYPDVFDAISIAVASGIVVVEPGGNGALDLDDPNLDGWFDREERDSGSIIVGGGCSPLGNAEPRTWYLWGSAYGSRVDVQGWYDSIVTTTTGDYAPDLFFPNGDDQQAYTTYFGGTSGASPMITGIAAIANSVAWELWGAPWDPWDLRQAMVSTGTPQPAHDGFLIGPQPDMRRLLRTYMVK